VATPESPGVVLGASGAVVGILVACTMHDPEQKVLFWGIIPVRIKYFVWGWLAYDLIALVFQFQDGVAHVTHLGGALAGYLYLKQDWRLGAFGRKVRAKRARRQMEEHTRRGQEEIDRREALTRETNRILEKINREGMNSLTEEELRTLREASRR
jgi:hypothetical protein